MNVAISFHRKNIRWTKNFTILDEQLTNICHEDTTENERQLNFLDVFISNLKELDKALMTLHLNYKSRIEISETLG